MAASIAFPYKFGCVTKSSPYKEAKLSTLHHPVPSTPNNLTKVGNVLHIYNGLVTLKRCRSQNPQQIGSGVLLQCERGKQILVQELPRAFPRGLQNGGLRRWT